MTDRRQFVLVEADVDAVRGLLDLMANFRDNDQRARYLLSSNWMIERGAAAAARAQANLDAARLDRAANQAARETKSPMGDIPIR